MQPLYQMQRKSEISGDLTDKSNLGDNIYHANLSAVEDWTEHLLEQQVTIQWIFQQPVVIKPYF